MLQHEKDTFVSNSPKSLSTFSRYKAHSSDPPPTAEQLPPGLLWTLILPSALFVFENSRNQTIVKHEGFGLAVSHLPASILSVYYSFFHSKLFLHFPSVLLCLSFLPSLLFLNSLTLLSSFLFIQTHEILRHSFALISVKLLHSYIHFSGISPSVNRNATNLFLKCHFKHLSSIETNTAELCGAWNTQNVELTLSYT